MNIKIIGIKDPGNKEKERIVISVDNQIDLGKYLIAISNELPDEMISSDIKHVKWLSDQALEAGDQVVIYTKSGNKASIKNSDGSTSYFYYWDLPNPIGADETVGVILFETSWQFKRVIPPVIKADEYDSGENENK